MNELHVMYIGRVEDERVGQALAARPEGLPGEGVDAIGRMEDEQLDDLVVEEALELAARPRDALLEGHRHVDQGLGDVLERLALLANVHAGR